MLPVRVADLTACGVCAACGGGGGQLGAGRYSTVRKATDRRTGATVALKRVQIFSIMDSKARGDCVNEVRSGAAKGGGGRALRGARAHPR